MKESKKFTLATTYNIVYSETLKYLYYTASVTEGVNPAACTLTKVDPETGNLLLGQDMAYFTPATYDASSCLVAEDDQTIYVFTSTAADDRIMKFDKDLGFVGHSIITPAVAGPAWDKGMSRIFFFRSHEAQALTIGMVKGTTSKVYWPVSGLYKIYSMPIAPAFTSYYEKVDASEASIISCMRVDNESFRCINFS